MCSWSAALGAVLSFADLSKVPPPISALIIQKFAYDSFSIIPSCSSTNRGISSSSSSALR